MLLITTHGNANMWKIDSKRQLMTIELGYPYEHLFLSLDNEKLVIVLLKK